MIGLIELTEEGMKEATRRTYGLWQKDRQVLLPYGVWRCADGSRVLFNRNYVPIYVRDGAGGEARKDENRRVDWIEQIWFYEDGTEEREKVRRGLAALAEWGIPAPRSWMKRYA